MARSSTIKDIAARVGVSTATVSAVLGNNPAGTIRVSPATRARITEAAHELAYRPNSVARSLRSRRTNIIGLYTAHGYLNPYVSFTAQLVGGLHKGCDEHGLDLLLHCFHANRAVETVVSELADGQIDGLILYTSADDPLIDQLKMTNLPVVAVVDAVVGLPSVVVDDAGGMRKLANYLWSKGHRRVWFRMSSIELASVTVRFAAFNDEAKKLGMVVEVSDQPHTHQQPTQEELEWMRRSKADRPTAAVCWNDVTAYHLLEYCRATGIRVPEDIAITGFDDLPSSVPGIWNLTTIHAPWVKVVEASVPLLMRRVGGLEIPEITTLPVQFVQGLTA